MRRVKRIGARTHVTRRRGASLLLVLALLTMTLALCYAMLRTQTLDGQIQLNFDRRNAARHAALTGLNVALHDMHQAGWRGVDSTLRAALDKHVSYEVHYQTGDAQLRPGDENYDRYPYRVTLTSVGRAADPTNASFQAEHTARAVVELVPRRLASQPSRWTAAQPYSVYQWGAGNGDRAVMEIPCRLQGPVRFQTRVQLAEAYPHPGDMKPFAGRIDEVALFAAPLSSEQIAALANGATSLAHLTVRPELAAVAWWRLDEAAGARVATDQLKLHHGRYDGAVAGRGAVPNVGGTAAAEFDGFDDQVYVGPVNVPGSGLSIVAWFRADHFNTPDARIISKAGGTAESDHEWMLGTVQAGNAYRLRFRMRTLGQGTETLVADSGDLVADRWVFAAAVFDGGRMRLYKDGVEVGSRTKVGVNAVNPEWPVSIGNNPPGNPRARYLRDLAREWSATGVDHRPLSGPVDAPRSRTDPASWSLLEQELGLLVNDSPADGKSPAPRPRSVTSYRLYPGGKSYAVPRLGPTLENKVLGPDPIHNPLGVFQNSGSTVLRGGAQVQGTVLILDSDSDGDLELDGVGVRLSPVTLPQLYGDSTIRQLPVAIVADDFKLRSGSADVTGRVVAGDDFEVVSDSAATACTLRGGVVARELELLGHEQWSAGSASWWRTRLFEYFKQLGGPMPIEYFPQWLEANAGLMRAPLLRIEPDPVGATYHWHDWSEPLLVPHPDDPGLRWDVVRWDAG